MGHLRIHLLLDNSQENLSPALLLSKAVKCAVLLILLLVIGRGEGEGKERRGKERRRGEERRDLVKNEDYGS